MQRFLQGGSRTDGRHVNTPCGKAGSGDATNAASQQLAAVPAFINWDEVNAALSAERLAVVAPVFIKGERFRYIAKTGAR